MIYKEKIKIKIINLKIIFIEITSEKKYLKNPLKLKFINKNELN